VLEVRLAAVHAAVDQRGERVGGGDHARGIDAVDLLERVRVLAGEGRQERLVARADRRAKPLQIDRVCLNVVAHDRFLSAPRRCDGRRYTRARGPRERMLAVMSAIAIAELATLPRGRSVRVSGILRSVRPL